MPEMDNVVTQQGTADDTAQVVTTTTNQTSDDAQVNTPDSENTVTSEDSDKDLSNKTIPYSRFSEVNTERNTLKQELEALRSELEERKQFDEALKTNPTVAKQYYKNLPQTQQEVDPAEAEAREILSNKLGYVTKDDVIKILGQADEVRGVQQKFVSRMDELTKKYDGSDGLPKFDQQEIAEYMDKHEISIADDPEVAYQRAKFQAIVDAVAKNNRSSANIERGGRSVQEGNDEEGQLMEQAKAGNRNAIQDLLMRRTGHILRNNKS